MLSHSAASVSYHHPSCSTLQCFVRSKQTNYHQNQKQKKVAADPLAVFEQENSREFDPQLKQIVSVLAPRLGGIEDSSDSIGFVTYQMYGIIRELITACIVDTPDSFDFATEIAVVGGVMINRRKVGTVS